MTQAVTLANAGVQGSAKAWVNFNGTVATPSTIRGSFNVTSVTKNGTGDYTINFTNALVDANFAAVHNGSKRPAVSDPTIVASVTGGSTASSYRYTTVVPGSATLNDAPDAYVAIFR